MNLKWCWDNKEENKRRFGGHLGGRKGQTDFWKVVVEQEAGLQDDVRVLPQVVVKGGTIHQIKTVQKRGDCLWVLQEELSSRICSP